MRIILLMLFSFSFSTLVCAQPERPSVTRFDRESNPAVKEPISSPTEPTVPIVDVARDAEYRRELDRGIELFGARNLSEAAAAFERATIISPSAFSASYNLGVTYLEMQKYDQAVLTLKQVLSLFPDSALAWHHLAYAYDNLRETSKAVECYREALARNPHLVGTNNNLGFDYLALKQYAEAETSFRRALQENATHKHSVEGMCLVSSILGNDGDAVSFCARATAGDRTLWSLKFLLAFSYSNVGRLDEAIHLFSEILVVEPNQALVHFGLGQTYRRKRDFSRAIANFQRAIQLNPNFSRAYAGLAVGMFKNGGYLEAKQNFSKALALDADDAESHYNLAITCLALKQRDCALEQYGILKDLDREAGARLYKQLYANRILSVAQH